FDLVDYRPTSRSCDANAILYMILFHVGFRQLHVFFTAILHYSFNLKEVMTKYKDKGPQLYRKKYKANFTARAFINHLGSYGHFLFSEIVNDPILYRFSLN
ncbi:hypothetical protein ACJX0J_018325, partial [Zea mays]